MTGFVSKSFVIPCHNGSKAYLTINIKSLNARYFEVISKLPFALHHLETACISIFKQALIRGHITFSIQVSNQNLFSEVAQPSLGTLKSYLHAIEQIQKEYKLPGNVTINDIIRLPNVLTIEEKIVDEASTQQIIQAVQQLTQELVAARIKEGDILERDMLARCDTMQREINTVEQEAQTLMMRRKQEISQALQLLEQEPADSATLKRNLLFAELDKIDIHEEIVRFKSHLQNLKQAIVSGEKEKGRRLDFILQELSREINTVAAKCSDVTIGSLAINIKVEIEKIREQVQNIV